VNNTPLITLSFCLFFGTALAEETTTPADAPPTQDDQVYEEPRDDSGDKKNDDAPAIASSELEQTLENVPVGELSCESGGFNLRTSEDDNAARHADLSSVRDPSSIGGVCMEATLEITHIDEARSVETPETSR
jgi:hypothetical protein